MGTKTSKAQTVEPRILGALRGELYRYERPTPDALTLREIQAQFKAEGLEMDKRRVYRLLAQLRERGVLGEASAAWPDARGYRNQTKFYWVITDGKGKGK